MSQMEVSRRSSTSDYDPESLYDDLVKTQSYLERLRDQKPLVAAHYDAWCDHRKVTIETFDSLQKRIDNVCVGCNVARGAGAAAGIVGVLTGILGAVLELKGYGSAKDVLQASKYCTGAGAVVAGSSVLLEMGLSHTTMNEIKSVLKKDMELTMPLGDWVETSREVDYLSNRLFQCNIASANFASIMRVFWEYIRLMDAGQYAVQDLLRDLQSNKMEGIEDLTLEVVQKVSYFFRRIHRNPRLIEPLREISKIFRETPCTFEFAKQGTMIYYRAFGLLDAISLTNLLPAASPTFPGFDYVLKRCVLDSVMIASHVMTIVLAVKNIKEGRSKYSEALDRVKFALSSELSAVTKQMNASVRRLDLDVEDILELRNLTLTS